MKHTTIMTTVDGRNQYITECQCCGTAFIPTKELHYIAKNATPERHLLLVAAETKQYDAFDCPGCGCQIVVGERLRPVDEAVFALGDIDEVHEYGRKEEDEDASGEECQSDNDCEDDA